MESSHSSLTSAPAKELGSDDSTQSGKKRVRSEAWQHFDRLGPIDGVEMCRCKYCKKMMSCAPKSGTSHLGRHAENCLKNPKYHDGDLLGNQTAKRVKFDGKVFRDALSKAIIMHDLPFSFADYEGINDAFRVLNPDFKPISRITVRGDCMKVYAAEKEKLKHLLASLRGRISLTSDAWTAVTVQGYMTVTAHFVDESWKLNSKLLAFVELDGAHTGEFLAQKLYEVLKAWGIDSKIFSITLDNAASNDKMVEILKERLQLQGNLLCEGEFFHIRCCAHILNLIVHGGLKVADTTLKRIRDCVKYVRSSEGRMREFHKCIQDENLEDVGGSFLKLDVPTRWNSTFLMLVAAIKYRNAITALCYNSRNSLVSPTKEEWERAEKMCDLLEPFYDITNMMSGSKYPTSNLYFMQVASIELKLRKLSVSEDNVIADMVKEMKEKFGKYWDDYSLTLAFGCVLDPNTKLEFLRYCYKQLDPTCYEKKVDKVKEALKKLFAVYEKLGESPDSHPNKGMKEPDSYSHHSKALTTKSTSLLDAFRKELQQESSQVCKSELDLYLENGDDANSMDVLEYWKVNSYRYPKLALLAKDILSIPITTVASESTFSIGGRILNKYRNSLLPETVQSLICTRNWLHGFNDLGAGSLGEDAELELEGMQASLQDSTDY